jgi:hypothetical protein
MKRVLCAVTVALLLSGCASVSAEEMQMRHQEQYIAEEAPAPEAQPAPAVAEWPSVPSVAESFEVPSTVDAKWAGFPDGVAMVRVDGAEYANFADGETVTTHIEEAANYVHNLFWCDGYMTSTAYDGRSISLYMSSTSVRSLVSEAVENGVMPEWWERIRDTFIGFNTEAMEMLSHYDKPIKLVSTLCDSEIRGADSTPFLQVTNGELTYDVFSGYEPSPQKNAQAATISHDGIIAILEAAYKDGNGLAYDIRYFDDATSYWIDVTAPDGHMAEIAQTIVNGEKTYTENWASVVNALIQVCNEAMNLVVAAGDDSSHVVVNLVNEKNTGNYLVTVFNGIITYDCTK